MPSRSSRFNAGKLTHEVRDKANAIDLPSEFYRSVADVVRTARARAYRAINTNMVAAYWDVGRKIVEEEQNGAGRAEYGARLIKTLAFRLTAEFGRGFDESNLRNFRQFFLTFRGQDSQAAKRDAVRRELTWTHYRRLMRVENGQAREWYLRETIDQKWDTRALSRQIDSLYYERVMMSRDKAVVRQEAHEKTVPLSAKPRDFIKDPTVLEFIDIEDRANFREAELEQAIIDKLRDFMLELGKGFAFVARQHRIATETQDFFVDLVFYNHILKCFVLIDLKSGPLTHQDVGQIDMYVRIFEDRIKGPDKSKPQA